MNLDFDIPRTFATPEEAARWVWEQLKIIQTICNDGADMLVLKELHEEPRKLFTGLVVLADGTDWDPGSGAGVYSYYGAAWHKLG